MLTDPTLFLSRFLQPRFIIYILFNEEDYLAYCTSLIYHKVLINNITDTEQDTTFRYGQRSRMPTPGALKFAILINNTLSCHPISVLVSI